MKKILTTLTLLITLCSFAFGQDDYYFEEPDNRQYNMTMTSVIFIDGVEDSGQNIEIAAFCGDEIRGRMTNLEMEYIEIPDVFARYFRYLHVNSEVTSGEIITFKAYNHDSGYELTSSSASKSSNLVDADATDATSVNIMVKSSLFISISNHGVKLLVQI